MGLLETAKSLTIENKPANGTEDEQIDLAIAFIKGEVSLRAAGKALGKQTGSFYYWFAKIIPKAYRSGRIKIL